MDFNGCLVFHANFPEFPPNKITKEPIDVELAPQVLVALETVTLGLACTRPKDNDEMGEKVGPLTNGRN